MVQPDQPHGPFPLAHLRAGLSQMLRCYDQAGIKRFPATPSWDVDTAYALAMSNVALPDTAAISANLQQAVAQVEDEAATTRALAASHAATASTPANENTVALENRVALENTVAAENIATIESSAHAIQNIPTHWQLPVLDATTRASRLQEIENTVRACRLCEELVGYRRQTVFGEGHLQPRVCFYGEAPGADEDAQGRPFVGAAGKLLTDIIHAMGLERSEVYILNSLKCRPPQNRTPLPEEVQACRPFAIEQLEILQPEVIVLLGAVAVRSVLDRAEPVGRLRGRFHTFRGARVLVTYHPAYLLRNPAAKKQVWEDMQIIMRELGLQPRTRK